MMARNVNKIIAMNKHDQNTNNVLTKTTVKIILPVSVVVYVQRRLFVRSHKTHKSLFSVSIVLAGFLAATLFLFPYVAIQFLHAEEHHHDSDIPSLSLSPSPLSVSNLEIFLYQDGLVHVSSVLEVDPLVPYITINLFGTSIDNFVAVGGNGFLLSEEISDGVALIDTFGIDTVMIDYDTHDLVSKNGRIWKFEIYSNTDFLLHMPFDAVLIGLDIIPDNLMLSEDHTLTLTFDSGHTELIYITTNIPIAHSQTHTPIVDSVSYDSTTKLSSAQNNTEPELFDITTTKTVILIVVACAISGVLAAVIMFKKNSKRKHNTSPSLLSAKESSENFTEPLQTDSSPSSSFQPLAPEQIFLSCPTLREDDKKIVQFIFDCGGVVMESDLRKEFVQPKTTMWRAVKRLERNNIVTTTKKDMQNQVRLVSSSSTKQYTKSDQQLPKEKGEKEEK